MSKVKIPVEIAGYVNRRIWVRNPVRGMEGFRWFSVVNEDYRDDEILPWGGDSTIDDCPF